MCNFALNGRSKECTFSYTNRKIQTNCREVIEIHLCLTLGHVDNNSSISPTHLGVQSAQ